MGDFHRAQSVHLVVVCVVVWLVMLACMRAAASLTSPPDSTLAAEYM